MMNIKAGLLLGIGAVSSLLLFLRNPTVSTAVLLALSIWAFSRAYYFAFYVIERYVDPTFRFSGLFAFAKYLFHRNR